MPSFADILLLLVALSAVGGVILAVVGHYQGLRFFKWSGILLFLAAVILAVMIGAYDDLNSRMLFADGAV